MPRRAPKRAYNTARPIKEGLEVPDPHSDGWIVGKIIGQGGFGCLYTASSKSAPKAEKYVLKIEPQENGPLFTETHFYARVCKQDLLDEWKFQHKLDFLGIPRFISKGTFETPDHIPCRFLVMDRFHGSLEDSLKEGELSPDAIPSIAIQVLDALEYIHSKDYVHADIKASNLLRMETYKFYLADFGLVSLFRIDGKHKPKKANPKIRDDGTLEFCSRDAHAGLSPSRRGDMEILLFNVVHWLYRARPNVEQGPCAGLPWNVLIRDPAVRVKVPKEVRDSVVEMKNDAMDPSKTSILINAVGLGQLPALKSLILAIGALGYEEAPDYSRLKELLKTLKTDLITQKSATGVLAEVNSGDTRSPRRRKAVSKTSAGGTPKPVVTKKPRSQSTVIELVGTSHQSDDEEVQQEQKLTYNTPLRRSARNRYPVISLLDSSEEEDDKNYFERVPAARRLPAKKETKPNNSENKNQRPAVHGTSIQTSPGLLKRLEREERRKNFF
ncbi:hypothetical protein Aperf_G00000049899 [Anoplocephala perfoliata]